MAEEIGNVEQRFKETEIEWKIPNVFLVAENKEAVNSGIFSFSDTSWRLELSFKLMYTDFSSAEIALFLVNVGKIVCSVEYKFGIKKVDGVVEHLEEGILEENERWNTAHRIKLSEIQRRKSELMSSDILIIVCILKLKTTHFISPRILKHSKVKNLIKLDTLSDDFKRLYSDKDNCDTTVLVMDKEYKAHRAVLIARSSVFAAMFQHDTTEKQTGIITIPDCDPESFELFLTFLYCGKLEETSSHFAIHLYKISDKYDVQELKAFCIEYLKQNFTVEMFCEIARFADKYDETELLSAAQEFFNENVEEIFDTSEWDSLVKKNYRLSKKLLRKVLPVKNVR